MTKAASSNQTALATVPPSQVVVGGAPRALLMREALQESSEQRALLGEFIREHMVEGTDYGVLPGTADRKALLKPGAEKLADIYRCTPEFEKTKEVEDWARGFFHYEFKARIRHRESGAVLGEGVGCANSMEGKYRWRTALRKCPTCSQETIIKGKEEYGGGWVCWKGKGGCGAKFAQDAQAIVGQPAGKVENDDIYSLVNTVLKMAKKRALVDAALALARVSDLFTQDVEEEVDATPAGAPPAPKKARGDEIKAKLGVAPKATTQTEPLDLPPAQPNTPYSRILEIAREHGADMHRVGSLIKGATGKTKPSQLDDDDVSRFQDALVAMKQMPVDFGEPGSAG